MARFTLPELPYAIDALAPAISRETLEFHWGKHHQTYVNNLNNLVEGTDWAEKSLEDIILGAEGGLFNNAAQVYNHTFFWSSMTPQGGGEPKGALKDALVARQLRLGLDVACEGRRRQALDSQHIERRHADPSRSQAASHDRRVGTRLLHRLPQRPSGLHQGLL